MYLPDNGTDIRRVQNNAFKNQNKILYIPAFVSDSGIGMIFPDA